MQSFLVGVYNKIPDSVRDKLVEMVVVDGCTHHQRSLSHSIAQVQYR